MYLGAPHIDEEVYKPVSRSLTRPHCHCGIEVLEPVDLDRMGLGPNPRSAAVESGALTPWARLRGGKLFLYLKTDVDAFTEARRTAGLRRFAKQAGFGDLSDEGVRELFTRAEKLRNREQGNWAT
jgi:hypothetical protein